MNRTNKIAFITKKLEKAYNELNKGKFEDKQLHNLITRAINDLKEDPEYGVRIRKKLIPKEYIKNYGINNLWKYNLPNGWRLVYSLAGTRIKVIAVILDWFDHKTYERTFKY